MNFKRLRLLSLSAALMFVFTTSAFAQELTTKQWRVFNINPDAPKLWDINKARTDDHSQIGFTFPDVSSGWYAVYLNTNYGDLTGKQTISVTASWTPSTYKNRGTDPLDPGAYFRVYFQSAQGNYTSNDYWWSSYRCDLNAGNTCTFTVDLNDRAAWSNLCGYFANDTASHAGPNCVGGTDPATSPSDGFTNAKRGVKDIGLSFGRAARFASGVANGGSGTTTFTLSSYFVQ
jgi:hypothetical protein